MAVGKKKPKGKNPDTPDIEKTLRGGAEKQLAHLPENSSDLKGQFPEALIHELRVHQIELETQAEELRKSKHALEESRDKYLDLYEFAPLGYFTLTDKALIAEVNLTGATLLGIERGKLINARFRKFIAEKDAEQWDRYFINVLNPGKKQCCTLKLKRGDNLMFPARLESIRFTDSDGTITVRVAVSDITDVSSVEDALRDSEERYRRITEGLTDYLYTVRVQDGNAVSTTHGAACVIVTGYMAEEFARDPYLWIRMVFDEDRERVISHFNGILSGKPVSTVEHRIVRKDGQIRWVLDTPVLQLDADGKLVSYDGVIKDITERKRAVADLTENEERLRTTLEILPVGVFIFSKNGQILTANTMVNKIWGVTTGAVPHSSDMKEFVEYKGWWPDTGVALKPEEWAASRVLLNGETAPVDIVNIQRFDGSSGTIIVSAVPIHDAGGNVTGAVAVTQDITDRKRAEDALMRVNQKLNVLSQLTRKDLTNQIFVLNSYLEMAKKQLTGQDHIIETVQKGVRAIQSVHETIEYSKDYQDMGVKPPKWQNINMTMLFGLSHISIGKIQHSLETENLEVFADPLLEKVCQRLFENSVKHGDHVTQIRIWHTETPEGATIFFEDDGIGISAEKKEQIFLRDESTGHASMRSLIFVREILDITGITIKETGEPGKGARFEMTVPKGAYRFTGTDKKDML